MTGHSLQEIKLKQNWWHKIKDYALFFLQIIRKNQIVIKSGILTLISLIFFLGILYPYTWQNQIEIKQSFFSLICIILYGLVSYFFIRHSHKNNFAIFTCWIQTNILVILTFAYFLRLNHKDLLIYNFTFNTGWLFVPLLLLIFLVNYNLFSRNILHQWLILPQVALFILQGYAFLSLTTAYITDSVSFTSDWLNIFFNLHPFFWLSISSVATAMVSSFSLPIQNIRHKFKVFSLFAFLMIQGILLIYTISFININLQLTYWNLALMALIYWDYIDTPVRIIGQKLEDNRFNARLFVSTIYHGGLFLIVMFTPQLQDWLR